MRITTKTEFGPFVKWIFSQNLMGKVTNEKHDDILEWGHRTLDHLVPHAPVRLPVHFIGLFREFQKSQNYAPDEEATLLALEDLANPPEYCPPTDDYESHNQGKADMRTRLTNVLDEITRDSKSSFDSLERARRGRSEDELSRAVGGIFHAREVKCHRKRAEWINDIVADPVAGPLFGALSKLRGAAPRAKLTSEEVLAVKSLTAGDFGGGLLPVGVAGQIWGLTYDGNAWSTVDVQTVPERVDKFPVVTRQPDRAFYLTEGTTIAEDTSTAGTGELATCVPLMARLDFSREWEADAVGGGPLLVQRLSQSIALGLEYGVFAATGAVDATNGGWTGIFANSAVPTVNAAAGNITADQLDREDFLNCIAGASPVTLMYPCRWWLHPSLLPSLLRVKSGAVYLIEPPEADGDSFRLLGYPITFVSAAPSTNSAGQPVAVFGAEDAYTVGIRQDIEVLTSGQGYGWAKNTRGIKAIARAKGVMRAPTGFSILKLATS
jgi:HK97 family phage major capsid protein